MMKKKSTTQRDKVCSLDEGTKESEDWTGRRPEPSDVKETQQLITSTKREDLESVLNSRPANIDEVRRAKTALKEQLGRPTWLRGIGIGGSSDDYVVKVNVDAITEEVLEAIPPIIEGVRVVLDPVGNIRPKKT